MLERAGEIFGWEGSRRHYIKRLENEKKPARVYGIKPGKHAKGQYRNYMGVLNSWLDGQPVTEGTGKEGIVMEFLVGEAMRKILGNQFEFANAGLDFVEKHSVDPGVDYLLKTEDQALSLAVDLQGVRWRAVEKGIREFDHTRLQIPGIKLPLGFIMDEQYMWTVIFAISDNPLDAIVEAIADDVGDNIQQHINPYL